MEKTPEHIFCNKSWKITHPRGKPTKPATIDNLSESWDLFCTPDLYPYYITLIMSNYCWKVSFLWHKIFISLPHSWRKPQILTVDKFLQIWIIDWCIWNITPRSQEATRTLWLKTPLDERVVFRNHTRVRLVWFLKTPSRQGVFSVIMYSWPLISRALYTNIILY